MEHLSLPRGANRTLPAEARRLRVVISWRDDSEADSEVDIDASALLLTGARRVRSDADFVFYNQPSSPDGAVHHTGRTRSEATVEERLSLDLDELGQDVEVVAIAASREEGTFGDLSELRLLLLDAANTTLAVCDIDDAGLETAFVFAEIYRRGGEWKVRSVAQGWDSGLAGLAQDFGVSIDDEPDESDDLAQEATGQGHGQNTSQDAAALPAAGPAAAGDAPLEDPAIDPVDDLVDDLVEVVDTDDAGAPEVAAASAYETGSTGETAPPTATVVATITVSTGEGAAPATTTVSGVVANVGADGVADDATAQAADPAPVPTTPARKGVRTRKVAPVQAKPPALRLAGAEGWQPARLFSIYGVGSAGEQEKRATSALLSTMMGVRAFARAIVSHFGAPGGAVEAYLEVPFELGEARVYPDGVLRVARAGKIWTGLVEVKTGDGQLRRDQVENYLDVARAQGFDAVITISNDIPPAAGEHPVEVDKRKLRKVALHHLSWAEVLHEAQMALTHRGVADPLQAWVLHELIRYLQHPRSGASGFEDMGSAWVGVREAVSAGTLRTGDRKVPAVAEAWIRLVRQLRLRLTAELGVTVTHVLPRKIATDPVARIAATTARLVSSGELEATVRVPGAAGPLTVVADLRTSQIRTSVRIQAPQEGGAQRRVTWLLRQLKDAPDDVLVDVSFSSRSGSTCERLGDVRDQPAVLLPERDVEVAAFTLSRTSPMGTKRSGVKNAFIPSVTDGLESFYTAVVQPLRAWVPPAPKLLDDPNNPDAPDDVAGGDDSLDPGEAEPDLPGDGEPDLQDAG
ncbi:TerD family protein [Kineococcus sp. SYSU DK003]|uniref:TerD family protein n=1 Tax=Kineococcus sp. SYSU DK003 TaxID=3383124 RepID=UPI003D7CAEBF